MEKGIKWCDKKGIKQQGRWKIPQGSCLHDGNAIACLQCISAIT